jgi:stage IV sporulation protein FB
MKYALPHFALGVFNLLPVMSLDGGHLLAIILDKRFSPRTVAITLKVTTFVFLLPLMTAGLYVLLNSGYNYSLLIISIYLIVLLFLKNR